MEELFVLAEQETKELKHPYVGTEHFMLAYLKIYGNKYISYDTYKKYILNIIGVSNIDTEYLLYTPILRDIKNTSNNIYDAMVRILTNDDSIAYNILLSCKCDIEAIYLNIINTNY